jgi:hypothetical protein
MSAPMSAPKMHLPTWGSNPRLSAKTCFSRLFDGAIGPALSGFTVSFGFQFRQGLGTALITVLELCRHEICTGAAVVHLIFRSTPSEQFIGLDVVFLSHKAAVLHS